MYDHLSTFKPTLGLSKRQANHSLLASQLLGVTWQRAGIKHGKVLGHFAQGKLVLEGRAEIAN